MPKKKGGGENIRVAIRCRNLLPHETERGDKQAVRMDLSSNQVIVSHPVGEPDKWTFDAVFNNTFSQRDIFVQEVKPLVDSCLQGYNATVFAYGQSGSGKTFTMTGDLQGNDPAKHGMMPQVVAYLFEEIKKMASNTRTFKVKVSYVELYNGKSRDLLQDRQVNLEIKQNMAGNFFVKGAEVIEVSNWAECMDQFNQGTDRRRTACTDLNAHSSRSHSLFMLNLESHDFEHDPSSPIIVHSKINVVDLAGSEKLGKTNASGDTMVEGCNINLSLSALATVIDKIVKGGGHIPYRGNALTMLLKDSLGGNSKTVMFANIGPSDQNVSETISTLRFADRAKQIENKPTKNLDPKDAKIQELLDKIEELQRRCNGADLDAEDKLKERISELEIANADLANAGNKDTIALEETTKQQAHQINQLEQQLREKDQQVQQVHNDSQLAQQQLRNDLDSLMSLKSSTTNFLKRIMSPEQLKFVQDSMPADVQPSSDGNWDVREIQVHLDGFQEIYEDWRRTVHTDEDMQKEAQRVRMEVEGQMSYQVQQLVAEKNELLRQRDEDFQSRAANTEQQSQIKVEIQHLKEENAKLHEKIKRDQEKMKAKVDKSKEEARALGEELDNARGDVQSRDREIQHLKQRLESGGAGGAMSGSFTGGGGGGGAAATGSPSKWHSEKQEMQQELDATKSRMREMIMAMRRKGISVANPESLLGKQSGGAPPPPPPPGLEGAQMDEHQMADMHNQAIVLDELAPDNCLDGDLVSTMQQQLRVQHRLHELRHSHQRKLDDLIAKYELLKTGRVTETQSTHAHGGEGTISEESLQMKIREALQQREDEFAAATAEHEKTIDKLVKKLNKKSAEFKSRESTLEEEKQGLEEEHAELTKHVDDLTKFNSQLALEVENHRSQLANITRQAESEAQLKGAEILHLRTENEGLKSRIEMQQRHIDEFETLQTEYKRLQELHQRTESSLKEKIGQIDNNRQMMKWTTGLLDEEKQKVHDCENQLRNAERQYQEMEAAWQKQLHEHSERLVHNNNKRLEEQSEMFQGMIAEEQDKQKLIREKLRKAKIRTSRTEQKFDEMVMENEILQTQVEDMKVNMIRLAREQRGGGDRSTAEDHSSNINSMIRNQRHLGGGSWY